MNKKTVIPIIILSLLLHMNFCFATEAEIPTWKNAQTNQVVKTSANVQKNNAGTNQATKPTSENIAPNNNGALKVTPATVTNNPLNLTCGGAILIEQNSGQVLYDYNMHQKLRPASVTKVMSLLLIMEAVDSGAISLTDKVPCPPDAAAMGGSQIWLNTTEELTVDELLKAVCVVSANDAVTCLADYVAGSQEAFAEKMNAKAKELGMNDTTFKNCHGIDEDGHVTSPYDIAIMSRELLTKHPGIMKYTTIYMDSLRGGKSQLVNTNKLVRNYEGCTGLKTGSTSLALFNLSASATRNNLSLIAVIMKGSTSKVRFAEASKLLNYGFANYQYKKLASKGDVVGECKINKGIKSKVNAICEEDAGVMTNKKDKGEVEPNIEIYNNIFAPVKQGQKVGEVTFKSGGNVVGKVNLVAQESDEKYGFKNMGKKVFKNWVTLLRTFPENS